MRCVVYHFFNETGICYNLLFHLMIQSRSSAPVYQSSVPPEVCDNAHLPPPSLTLSTNQGDHVNQLAWGGLGLYMFIL